MSIICRQTLTLEQRPGKFDCDTAELRRCKSFNSQKQHSITERIQAAILRQSYRKKSKDNRYFPSLYESPHSEVGQVKKSQFEKIDDL